MLIRLTKPSEIKDAQRRLGKGLRANSQRRQMIVGYKGGSEEVICWWNPRERFWFVEQLDRFTRASDGVPRSWCCFGLTKPDDPVSPHSIVCEVNVPTKTVNRNVGGAFAIDDLGEFCVTHNGKLAGGRKGIGKSTFLSWYPGGTVPLLCKKDCKVDEVILVASLEPKDIQAQVGRFVRLVAQYKKEVTSGQSPLSSTGMKPSHETYEPEFAGQRRPYKLKDSVKAYAWHGVVIDRLREYLEDAGLAPYNDKPRDLYLSDKHGNIVALFEAKTDDSTSSIYSAIGQLHFHGGIDGKRPLRIFVAPELSKATRERLTDLGIRLLPYKRQGKKVTFEGLKILLREIKESHAV